MCAQYDEHLTVFHRIITSFHPDYAPLWSLHYFKYVAIRVFHGSKGLALLYSLIKLYVAFPDSIVATIELNAFR